MVDLKLTWCNNVPKMRNIPSLLTFFSIFQMNLISSAMATTGLWVTMTGLASWAEAATPVTGGSPSQPGDTSPWPRNNRYTEQKNRKRGTEIRAKNWINLKLLGCLDYMGFWEYWYKESIALDQAQNAWSFRLRIIQEHRDCHDPGIFLVSLVDRFGCCPSSQLQTLQLYRV